MIALKTGSQSRENQQLGSQWRKNRPGGPSKPNQDNFHYLTRLIIPWKIPLAKLFLSQLTILAHSGSITKIP